MNKQLVFFCFFICFLFGNSKTLFASEFETEVLHSHGSETDRYILNVYEHIAFGKEGKLSFQAFEYGFHGYLNLVEAGKICPTALLTICDFTLSSNTKRMWVIDLVNTKVLFNTLVAHGMGTGEEFATAFSNTLDSHQSSLGFYVTGETYDGNNGYSLKLEGVDGSFNSNAYERAIVIHGAAYVSEHFACVNKRIGRSHGCPALPVDIAPKIINEIKNGSCLFIYHDSKNYLASSYWLRTKVKSLPIEANYSDMVVSSLKAKRIAEVQAVSESVVEMKSNAELKNVTNQEKQNNEMPQVNMKPITSILLVTETRATGIRDTMIVR